MTEFYDDMINESRLDFEEEEDIKKSELPSVEEIRNLIYSLGTEWDSESSVGFVNFKEVAKAIHERIHGGEDD